MTSASTGVNHERVGAAGAAAAGRRTAVVGESPPAHCTVVGCSAGVRTVGLSSPAGVRTVDRSADDSG
ncbi:hypothetical protein [Pseudonocardia aurantiaca]|uniref:Uncharacterized protein n=1 Tax=Pseudonocardia aurantiaca TaxID=75290 RepID=A0ABW4FBT3_9PSEU